MDIEEMKDRCQDQAREDIVDKKEKGGGAGRNIKRRTDKGISQEGEKWKGSLILGEQLN